MSSWATTDLASGTALDQGPAFRIPFIVLCSEFLQSKSYRGKDGKDKKGASSSFFTFQKLENKSDRLPRMQDPPHPMTYTPPEAMSEAGAEGPSQQFNRLSCHCIPQFGTKLTPIPTITFLGII